MRRVVASANDNIRAAILVLLTMLWLVFIDPPRCCREWNFGKELAEDSSRAVAACTWRSTRQKAEGMKDNVTLAEMVGPARFERATLCLEGRCSIQLSYGPVGLFYQRKRNSKRQIIQFRRRGAEVYTCLLPLAEC